jgi:site-specific recombinase XerC
VSRRNLRARTRKTRARRLTAENHVSRGELRAIELAERLTALATSPGGIRFDVPHLAVVKDLLGHRHLATTARYVHPEWEQMRDAIDDAYVETVALDQATGADGG